MPQARFVTSSEEGTKEVGRQIGELLVPGSVVCLFGELGTGKTVFVKGLASALGIEENEITSASFVIVAEHYGRIPLYHIDLYRINSPEELYTTGIEEYLPGDGITVIEWAERLEDPAECVIRVYLREIDYNSREIIVSGDEDLLKGLRSVKL